MKLIYLLLCFILIWQNNYVNGDLKEFLNGIHGAAHKVRQDVRSFLHLNPKGDQEKSAVTDDKKVTTEKSKSPESVVTQGNDHNAALVNSKDDGTGKTVTELPTTTPAAAEPKSSQQGKEIFDGSVCAAGYVRTADGRCKPNF